MISKKTLCLPAQAIFASILPALILLTAVLLTQILTPPAFAQPPAPPAPKASPPKATPGDTTPPAAASRAVPTTEAAIRAVLDRQAFDWNRGDTEGFLTGYAPEAVFVSDQITRGLEKVRVRYQSHYPTRASMGTLTFSDIEVHSIDPNNAYVIGRFQLKRDAEGGGDTQGVYTLFFKRTPKGWKIVLDHTS
jgi:uncharacterized protein (TIGR02246 family)